MEPGSLPRYDKGMSHFFNTKRNEGKVGEILRFLPVIDKFKLFVTCRSTFTIMKREYNTKSIASILKPSLENKEINEIKIIEVYHSIENLLRNAEYQGNLTESALVITAGVINRFIIEPIKFKCNQDKRYQKADLAFSETLSFFKGSLDTFELKIICKSLAFNQTLKSLSFRGCKIDDSSLKYILSHLTKDKNITLESLDLMYNEISDEGCKYIRDFLMHSNRLSSLSIGMNKLITVMGLNYISCSLLTNSTLKKLKLQGMSLNWSYIETLNNIIVYNQCISVLELQNNELDSNCMSFLESGLKSNSTLKEINLTGNPIKDEGIKIFVKILLVNTSIEKVEFKSTEITDLSIDSLLNLLKVKKNLKYIGVTYNSIKPKLIEELSFSIDKINK